MCCPANLPGARIACRIGFFITTPAAEGQLELDLAEGKCPLDAKDITITLFTFDALDPATGSAAREFRLADMLLVRSACGSGADGCLVLIFQSVVSVALPWQRCIACCFCATLQCRCVQSQAASLSCFPTLLAELPCPLPVLPTASTSGPLTVQDYMGGEFSLFFANCEPDSAIDFDVEVSLYNVRGECYCRRAVMRRRRCVHSVRGEWYTST